VLVAQNTTDRYVANQHQLKLILDLEVGIDWITIKGDDSVLVTRKSSDDTNIYIHG
jgi:hypothetical protein